MMGNDGTQRCPECGLVLYQDVAHCPRCLAPIAPSAPATPVVERIYEHEAVDTSPRERGGFKRPIIVISVVIMVALLITAMAYLYLIPRTDLKVITVYRESTGLSILVDSKVENDGTLNIQHLTLNITVLNASGGIVAQGGYYLPDLDSHSSHGFDNIHFLGDQYEPYTVNIKVHFESAGQDYTETYDHSVKEYMFLKWEDSFMKWGG
ncbi:MAG: hypothetical protein JSW28_01110 [Thermoplasmata archaeon]|nr:MAG: hypothetical protein JSW28_01110 [Thermoplasmata archaeon]